MGTVYVFNADTGALINTIPNPFPQQGQDFGASIAALGNSVLVAAPEGESGAAYLFDGPSGQLRQTFSDPEIDSHNRFGSSVAASGDSVLVGAEVALAGGAYGGAAYVFR